MSRHVPSDEELRQAFQSVPVSSALECSPDDVDRVWRAVAGELPAAERRSLVERLSNEPALAEAWRMAHHGQRPVPVADAATESPRRLMRWLTPSFAAAAVLVLAIATAVLLRRDGSDGVTLRDAGQNTIESFVAANDGLPRDAFRLRWSAGPADSRYDVRVTNDNLDLLAAVTDLSEPELVVDPASLAGVPSGTRVFWQVGVLLPGGERIVSPTFVVRLRP